MPGPPPSPVLPPGGDTDTLNTPPPAPAQPLAGPPPGLSGPGSIQSGLLPPEVLTGLLQVGKTMGDQLDTFAQIAPDLAPDVSVLKDQLQRLLGKLLVAGGTAASPTSLPSPFAGGGQDRGGASSQLPPLA